LRIWHKLDVEDSGNGDIAKILLMRYDGLQAPVVPLAEYHADTTPAGTWVSQVFNLAAFKTTPFRIEFMFISDGDANVGTGWLLDDYDVIDADPQIASLSPSRAKLGDTITVNGSNFGGTQGTSTVTFAKTGGGRVAATVNSWSGAAIQVVIPNTAAKGDVIVNVLGYDSNGSAFALILAPPTLQGLVQQ
jgi:hypothetical protein